MKPINPQIITRIKELSAQLQEPLSEMAELIRESGSHDYELVVNKGGDKFYYSSALADRKTFSQHELEAELVTMLDQAYPRGVRVFMGMVYSPNRNVAQAIAHTVAEHRKRDRQEVASQLFALIAAFGQSD